MSLKDKMKADRNALDELVAKIPGFRGYKEREVRRDADRVLRQHVSQLLEEQRKRLNELQVQLLEGGQVDLLDDLERIGTKVQGVINRLKTAAYGYAGLFDAVKVNEEQLDALYRFDEKLLNLVAELRDALDGLGEALDAGEELGRALKHLQRTVDGLSRTVRKREKVVVGEALPEPPAPAPAEAPAEGEPAGPTE